jgi:hypothetical protein
MPKRSRATLKGMDLAKLVFDLHKSKGRSPTEARDLVIREWLLAGDPEPFLEWAGEGVGPDVLSLIADMLAGDADLPYHLVVKRHRGTPKKPGLHWRDIVVALLYEQQTKAGVGYEVALAETADMLGISVSSVRGAVRWYNGIKRSTQSKKL